MDRARAKLYYQANKDRVDAKHKEWCANNPEKVAEVHRRCYERYYPALRAEILQAYGGKCACCGKVEEAFLQVDHINNDGAEHRRRIGRSGVWRDLKRRGFPKDEYQLLCANCNWGKRRGVCPHKKIPREEVGELKCQFLNTTAVMDPT